MEKYEIEHIEMLRKDLAGCTVLLRKNGAFPLEGPCRIEAAGSGVSFTVKGGTGSGEVNSRYYMNIEEGLEQAGFRISNKGWSRMYKYFEDRAHEDFLKSIRARAKKEKINIIAASMGAVQKAPEYTIPLRYDAEAAIYVVSRISGEGNDRLAEKGDFKLTDSEVRDILALNDHYDKFMLVINSGGPVDLSPVDKVGNILVLSQLGVETGSVLADILLGRAYPSGKLATTWTVYEDYSTLGDFAKRDDTRYREGIYVGYRYFDAVGTDPMFPFGYGLGYADFALEKASVRQKDGRFDVTVKVTNTGSFPGRETVQAYISCPEGKLDKEIKSLTGFAKTSELKPGESESVRIRFDIADFASYDEEAAAYVLEKGKYIILTGNSSADLTAAAVYELAGDFTVRKTENLFPGCGFTDHRNFTARSFELKGLKTRPLQLSGRETVKVDYSISDAPDYPVLEEVPDSELMYLNIGAFDPKAGLMGVIGDAGRIVPGAAGETSGILSDQGIPALVLADGPAGVRIASRYYEDSKGKHNMGSALPQSMVEMLPAPVRAIAGREKKAGKNAVVKEQYCTAIPIATALAQSFDLDFAERCGDIVGSEMERFNIDLWLAPALNIHRNVLCGRNFEYYSEDPLVSGLFAAAVTKGVQKHPGCGATIKHFAANNQETNRYANNSLISERALREIYLKGFGICIRESQPMAVMTSYNLLNGIHTSESRELTTLILRNEYGFDGLVMTDWVVGGDMLLFKGSKYGTPDPAVVAAAGCSLFMPGCKADYNKLKDGMNNGTVSRKQLEENSAWLMHVIDRLGRNH